MQFGSPLTLAGQTVVFSGALTNIAGPGGQAIFNVPPGTRTLVLRLSPTPAGGVPIDFVTVVGNSSGYDYYSAITSTNPLGVKPPYLITSSAPFGFICVVPIAAAVDTGFVINVVYGTATSCNMIAWADPLLYDESNFYNGKVQVASVQQSGLGTATVLTGPARLLSASMTGVNAGAGQPCNMFINGNFLMVGGGLNSTPNIMTFPDNTILQIGQTVTIQSFAAGETVDGSVAYAYP
jgi:hypothetical protein